MFDNFTFQASTFDAVSEGRYNAEYIGNEEIVSKFEKDGKAVAWRWKIVDGPNAGKVVTRVSGKTPTPKNGCGRILIALLGKTPTTGENVSVKDCIGKRYLVVVVKNESGEGTKVDTVVKMP